MSEDRKIERHIWIQHIVTSLVFSKELEKHESEVTCASFWVGEKQMPELVC
jgi:hypothetical protein